MYSFLLSVRMSSRWFKTEITQSPVPDYTDLNVSTKVVKIIQSYVGIINKNTWRRF